MPESRKPRLILLEGGPATGKSTTATFLHERLPGSNLYTEFGCENPVYDSWTLMKYILRPAGIGIEEPERSAVEALPTMTAEEFQAATIRSLNFFGATSIPCNIFDSTFLGNTILMLLLYFEVEEPVLRSHISDMIACVRRLNPLLIHYRKNTMAEMIDEMEGGRPGHRDWVMQLTLNSPYAKRRKLPYTNAGLAVLAAELFRVGQGIADSCEIPTLSVESSVAVWRQDTQFHEKVYQWVTQH